MRTFAVLYCLERREFFDAEILGKLVESAHTCCITDWGAALILANVVPEIMSIEAYREFSGIKTDSNILRGEIE